MALTYTKGDIIETFKSYEGKICLLHQCNCNFKISNRHGAGVALLIATTFPEMVEAESLAIRLRPENFFFGTMFYFEPLKDKFIINLFSQKKFGSPEGLFDDYILYGSTEEILKQPNQAHLSDTFSDRCGALIKAVKHFKNNFDNSHKVLIPLIASGLAKHRSKSNMNDFVYFLTHIAPIINHILIGYDVNVVVYKKK